MEMEKKMLLHIPTISIAKAIFGRDLIESIFSLFLCTVGDLFTGLVMGAFTGYLKLLPALIILIPPTIGMRGNIFASLGSRLGTYLHTGEIEPTFRWNPILSQNVGSSMALTGIMSIFLGVVSAIVANLMGIGSTFQDMILISVLAGIMSALIMLFFTFLVAFLSFKKGWDPDNVSAPIITLVGDMVTLPIMFIFVPPVIHFNSWIKDLMSIFLFVLIVILPYLYDIKGRKDVYLKIMKEGTLILLICGLIDITSGSILSLRLEGFISTPGLLILIPPFLEDSGAIGGILASRISSSLHLGTLSEGKKFSKKILILFMFSHTLSLFVFSMIAIFGYLSAKIIGIPTFPLINILLVSIIAGELLTIVINFLTYYTATVSFKRGIDPDNVTIPIITSTMDLIGSVSLVAVLMLFGMV